MSGAPYKSIPPCERLRTVFTYCPETGLLYWNYREDVKANVNSRFAGKVAGSYDRGHLTVRYNGELYFVHRIIFVMIYGDCLSIWDEIDHADLDGTNNKQDNIRLADRETNNANKDMQSNNTSGAKSVDQLSSGRWRARIKGTHIGVYNTIKEANDAYGVAAESIYGEFGRRTLLA